MEGLIILIILAAAVICCLAEVVSGYNGLVLLRNRVDNQSAQVDVQLKRRAELIPNLIETVKGYAKFEKSTLAEITELRSRVANSTSTREACVADTGFLKLQEEIAQTEREAVKIDSNTF